MYCELYKNKIHKSFDFIYANARRDASTAKSCEFQLFNQPGRFQEHRNYIFQSSSFVIHCFVLFWSKIKKPNIYFRGQKYIRSNNFFCFEFFKINFSCFSSNATIILQNRLFYRLFHNSFDNYFLLIRRRKLRNEPEKWCWVIAVYKNIVDNVLCSEAIENGF